MTIEFTSSPDFTVGIELEFQLVAADSWDLVNGVLPLMGLSRSPHRVKPEYVQNTVEVASSPCADVAELAEDVIPIVEELIRDCGRLGLRLCSAGTHPFNSAKATITPLPRYLEMLKTSGYWRNNQITFATHVHVGVSSGDQAVTLIRALKPYLPLLIALSANSPFWRSEDTQFAGFRHRLLAPSRSYGLPPDFADWQAFERFYAAMTSSGRIGHIDEMHWDIRPRPGLGTVEVRVMDAQTRLVDAFALAAFVRALVSLLLSGASEATSADLPCPRLPWWALKDNCYLASRNGLETELINSVAGAVVPMQRLIEGACAAIEPFARRLGEEQHLAAVEQRAASGGAYGEQRRLLRSLGSFESVVEALSGRLLEGLLVTA